MKNKWMTIFAILSVAATIAGLVTFFNLFSNAIVANYRDMVVFAVTILVLACSMLVWTFSGARHYDIHDTLYQNSAEELGHKIGIMQSVQKELLDREENHKADRKSK